MAATSAVGAGLVGSTGLASAYSQEYLIEIEQAGYSSGEYKVRMDVGDDGGGANGSSIESEDDSYWDGTVLYLHGYVEDGNPDSWDCYSVGDLEIVDADTDNCDIYQDGTLVGSY